MCVHACACVLACVHHAARISTVLAVYVCVCVHACACALACVSACVHHAARISTVFAGLSVCVRARVQILRYLCMSARAHARAGGREGAGVCTGGRVRVWLDGQP